MTLTLSELDGLRRLVEEHDAKTGLIVFCSQQIKEHAQECVNFVKRGETLKAAVEAGRLDVYENLLSLLEHFVKTTKV